MSRSILNVVDSTTYEYDSIVRLNYHIYLPFTYTTFYNNDEIRIPIHQQDVYTLPCGSYLHIKFELTNNIGVYDASYLLISNAVAFLFDEIRCEINGSEVDRVQNLGISTCIKKYVDD